MKKYAVKVTIQAQEHILTYASYIRNKLMNSVAAEQFVRGLWDEIRTLESMPERYPCLDDEP